MFNRPKSKLKSRRGFTLAETLMAVIILLLVSAVIAAGIPVAARAYENAVTAANAQVLISTAMTCLRDELNMARNINCSASTLRYVSENGSQSVLSVDPDEGIKLQEYTDIYVPSGPETADKYTRTLVSDSAANKNLLVKYDSAVYDQANGVVRFTNLAVYKKSGGDPVVAIGDYSVKVLAGSLD